MFTPQVCPFLLPFSFSSSFFFLSLSQNCAFVEIFALWIVGFGS
uniref:Uncharacterized protein n=1 Tax=Rhizophora mucronata TaxID=61149 RepID=A0A2P2QH59_RHIMU